MTAHVKKHHLHVPVPGGRVAVDRLVPEGVPADPVLVFLHEALGSIAQWRDFPARLAAATGLQAVVYDRLGFGKSDPREDVPRPFGYLHHEAQVVLPAVLEACGISAPILFGHSDGGTIALLHCAAFPGKALGAITEAAHVFVEVETRGGIEAAIEAWRTTDLEARLARYHGAKTRTVFAAWTETWLAPSFRSWDIRPELKAISCPLLVIQGADDVYGTKAQVEGIVQGTGGPATAMMIPGCGHTPHKEAEKAVLESVTAFVAKRMRGR